MQRVAIVLLVDPDGRVLLQERDEHAPTAPGQWGMVGGHVEEGEDLEAAARRELAEETGVDVDAVLPDGLRRWCEDTFTYPDGRTYRYGLFAARVDLCDDDIVVGEGRQIVFVEPERALGLDLGGSAVHFVPRFLGSDLYRELAGG